MTPNWIYGKNGCPSTRSVELFYFVDFIDISDLTDAAFIKKVAKLRSDGLTFNEISLRTGVAASSAHRALKRHSESLNLAPTLSKNLSNGSTPFGYYLYQGKLVPDPREQKVVQIIVSRWQNGLRHNAIAEELNRQSLVTKTGKQWTYFAVRSVILRHLQETTKTGDQTKEEL